MERKEEGVRERDTKRQSETCKDTHYHILFGNDYIRSTDQRHKFSSGAMPFKLERFYSSIGMNTQTENK